MVDKLKKEPVAGLWLYGTIGYGKSHILAALACYLTTAGDRVVYIPDSRVCAKDPVVYIRVAMLLAWADDSGMQEKIMALKTIDAISDFFQSTPTNPLLIIDQMNALARSNSSTDDYISSEEKTYLSKWINSCAARYKCIFSASANYQTFCWMRIRQTNELHLYAY